MTHPASNFVRTSLAEQAYQQLEYQLVTLEFPPGQFLQEQDLSGSLGIGRTPVREALQRLAGHGLLTILPRKGLQVAPLRRRTLGQVIEARRVIERLLVVKAAERAEPEQRVQLRSLADELDRIAHGTDRLFQLDRTLDDLLSAACDNPYLVQSLAPLHIHCRRLWYLNRDSLDVGQAAQLHAHLARAVAGRDGAGAIRALNGIISILEQLHARLEAIP